MIKYSESIKLNLGAQIYNIEKTNLDHFYLIDGKDINSFGLYSKSHKSIKYAIGLKSKLKDFLFL